MTTVLCQPLPTILGLQFVKLEAPGDLWAKQLCRYINYNTFRCIMCMTDEGIVLVQSLKPKYC